MAENEKAGPPESGEMKEESLGPAETTELEDELDDVSGGATTGNNFNCGCGES